MLLQSAIGITKCERTDVFSFVVHAEFEVGVLAPEEFRWKIFLGEDLEPLVVLVCHLHGKLFVMLTEPPSVEGNLTSESAPRVQVPYARRLENEGILDTARGNDHFQQHAWRYFALKRLLKCSDDRSLPLVEKICDSMGF